MSNRAIAEPGVDDLGPILHEEVNRLPERFRAAVVLCYLEGFTHEQAAERLSCPVGTVRSRLSTGRERLRGRLERRGFASTDDAMASALGSAATVGSPVPPALTESAVRIGLGLASAMSSNEMVPASVVTLAERGLKMMWSPRLTVLSLTLLAIGGGTIGALALAQRGPGAPAPAARAKSVPDSSGGRGAAIPSAVAAKNQARRRLLEARIETVEAILKQDMERIKTLIGDVSKDALANMPDWTRRLMQDRLALAATPAERLAALREYRERMLFLEHLLRRYAETGQGTIANALKGKYYRLEADQLLVEEGVDPSQEAVKPEPEPAPGPPPPLPPAPR